MLPVGGIALVGAPDGDLGLDDARTTPVQAMQVDITQDIVDALLESIKSEKPPQILFGRTPVCVPIFRRPLSCVTVWCCARRQGGSTGGMARHELG